ncbi:hypothetical protein [Fructobacillus fructosus]|uniref:hypothetical protein n=1 Tax=Fructobacillus fructosus TaxID=1631 RepID=UPI002D936FAD|nr:unnamed protein product [Fructobacillus fructosus]CAK1237483.1 unnamed protein product [Fructobacillus fructosus]CAK1238735.1 unnamed protein product [Fructobacillus fructosus]
MKQALFSSLIGTIVFFLVIHLWFHSGSLREDLTSSIIFFVIFTGVNWVLKKTEKIF